MKPEDCPAVGLEAGEWLTWGDPEGNFEILLGQEWGCLLGRILQLSASG